LVKQLGVFPDELIVLLILNIYEILYF